ncbi:cell division protein FtsX [Patescibacteria group bacterium]
MYITNLKRIIKAGFVNFWRNGVVSFASVLIMTVTLASIGLIMFAGALLNNSLVQIKNKVDVNIYFTLDASEGDMFSLQTTLEGMPEVERVVYTSREEALENFRKRHENDYLTIQALDELDDNPLGASLSIKAKETSQYANIAKFLEDKQGGLSGGEASIIDKVNYYQNKVAIDRLTKIIDGAERIGFAMMIFLILISVIITFNTIRLAIYTSREEIGVMRLVGANNKFIRGPFIIEGVMYGVAAAILALVILYPIAIWLGGATETFFGGINLLDYYYEQFWQMTIFILIAGIGLGVLSSYLAVRRYLHK